jgi:Uri superfamily endonuclease
VRLDAHQSISIAVMIHRTLSRPDDMQPGTYILIIALPMDTVLTVGSLGKVAFAAGYYLYVGSALGGLQARLARHLRAEKRLHWHIDYLLQVGRICTIWYALGNARRECMWARTLAAMPDIRPAVARFGASDCACPTHLYCSAARPDREVFQTLAHENLEARNLPQVPGPAGG